MIEQIAIALLGVTAIFLSQDHRTTWRKWACVFGLLGQPFWFVATIKAGQWGIVVLCCFYTLAWARGIKTNWLTNKGN
jgi:hypothetical protein